ncbi:sensor histidine kinase [Peptacetobacter hominis]|nr:HAMP domain-containing sensor histidine kinase [Peptacetobacter hominis]
MGEEMIGLIFLVIICIIISVLIIYINHCRTKRLMDSLEKMIDSAIEGNNIETKFDESRLSALETKFYNYISSLSVSANNTAIEKDNIKTLISDISHQTKTPIANLLLHSELICEDETLPESIKSDISIIREQTEKLHFLIDSLIKLSRLENGILSLSPLRNSVQIIFDDIFNQYNCKANNKGLSLIIKPTQATAIFDFKWTVEAIGNIVDNAIKYTENGTIVINATEYELFTRIDITDTGIGIDESEQPKVFSRFYRSESVRENDGVGIGLYLVRKIISSEGGYIKLISKKGCGSTFSVFLQR